MKVAPFRALTPHTPGSPGTIPGGNEGRPFQGIDTICIKHSAFWFLRRGNEGRPFQGIDTLPRAPGHFLIAVEMKPAPFRALPTFLLRVTCRRIQSLIVNGFNTSIIVSIPIRQTQIRQPDGRNSNIIHTQISQTDISDPN